MDASAGRSRTTRVRTVLIVTAPFSSILGAVVADLVVTVPNDVQAAALMKSARKQIAALGRRIDETATRPVPQPVVVPAASKKSPAKKRTTKRRTTSRRRR